MTFNLGDDYEIDGVDGGDLTVTHTPSGETFRFNQAADEWSLGTLRPKNQQHGADVSDDLGKKSISPNVSDLGAAVNQAISELAPAGGVIELPAADVPINTQIDLSDGANNQTRTTPLKIKGVGSTRTQVDGSEVIYDASGLADHVFFQDGTGIREHVHIEGVSVTDVDANYDGIHVGIEGGGATRWTLRDILIDGGDYGYNIGNMYGATVQGIHSQGAQRGVKMDTMNATNVSGVSSRFCDDPTAPAIHLNSGRGFNIRNLYAEGNDGRGLSLTGAMRNAEISGVYLEGNNESGQNDHEVIVGDSDLASGVVSGVTIGGVTFQTPANAFNAERLVNDNADSIGYKSVGPNIDYLIPATGRGVDNVMERCKFGDVNTNAGATTWIACDITGTVNKDGSDTTLSGD